MTRADRQAFLRRHAFGLMGLVLIYILLTVIRSIRDDFAVEILEGLDYHGDASVYAWIELLVVFGVLVINGGAIFVRNNRLAFLGAFGLIAGGFLLVLTSLWGLSAGLLSPFAFMVVIGLGTYVPYVAYHTTVFERMLSLFRERGNIGYVFYIADATGYLATVGILVMKDYLTKSLGYVRLLTESSFWLSCVSLAVTVALFVYYFQAARQPKEQSAASPIATESV